MARPGTAASDIVTLGAAAPASIDPRTNTAAPVVFARNNFDDSTKLSLTVTNGTADPIANIPIKRGVGDISKGLPSGVTISTAFGSYANLQDYLEKVGMLIDGITVSTSNTANSEGGMVVGERTPDGLTNKQRIIDFTEHRVGTGNGTFDSVFDVKGADGQVQIVPQLFMTLQSLAGNSSMKFTFKIVGVNRSVAATAADA